MISLITCVYNQNPNYFIECIKSVENQDTPVEWIIVDDGSDNSYYNTYKECLAMMKNNHKVNLLRLPQNMGLSYARNEGIRRANYDWIVVLDSDDWLAPNLFRNITLLPPNIKLVNCSVEYFDEHIIEYRPVTRWRTLYNHFGRTIADPFLWFDFYYHGIIAKKKLLNNIGGYKNNLKLGEDQDILIRACEAIKTEDLYFMDEVGYHYRNNREGVCTRYWPIVEKNYCATMTEASRRRGSIFIDCKFMEKICIDGAMIDTYSYKEKNRWVTWNGCIDKYFSIKEDFIFLSQIKESN